MYPHTHSKNTAAGAATKERSSTPSSQVCIEPPIYHLHIIPGCTKPPHSTLTHLSGMTSTRDMLGHHSRRVLRLPMHTTHDSATWDYYIIGPLHLPRWTDFHNKCENVLCFAQWNGTFYSVIGNHSLGKLISHTHGITVCIVDKCVCNISGL